MPTPPCCRAARLVVPILALLAACKGHDATTAPITQVLGFKSNPCTGASLVQLDVNTATRVDCGNGGTTLTFAGQGASYLIVPQFATDQAPFTLVQYTMATGTLKAGMWAPLPGTGSAAMRTLRAVRAPSLFADAGAGTLPPLHPNASQRAADDFLRRRGAAVAAGGRVLRTGASGARLAALRAVSAPPAVGSLRSFHVASSFTGNTFKSVSARLAYAGTSVLLYIDTTATTGALTPDQQLQFGRYVDQTLYAVDTAAFGGPSDVDGNGRVIMLMSPVVNADTPKASCATAGYTAGFFDPGDFNGPADPNSNQGEVFYAIAPDSAATFSCAHSAATVMASIPATFMHELQHLIYFSQHVVIGGGTEGASWIDEGLSIVAEELGSRYYEDRCPPPACRTNAAQLFPDSAQGFVNGFLYDSYQYALMPDTASITLSDDSMNGFSWRGGAWLMLRWLGDQFGAGIYKTLERGASSGPAAIAAATGQPFPDLFAAFGLALHTDSLAGLPRATAPARNRFTSRNVKQLWARLYATSGGATDVPLPNPLQLFPITTDTTVSVMFPGTTTYFRLDTPAAASSVSIRFASPGGAAFSTTLKPQLAIYRLPPGQ